MGLCGSEVDSALKVAAAGLRLLRAAEDLPGELVALKAYRPMGLWAYGPMGRVFGGERGGRRGWEGKLFDVDLKSWVHLRK